MIGDEGRGAHLDGRLLTMNGRSASCIKATGKLATLQASEAAQTIRRDTPLFLRDD